MTNPSPPPDERREGLTLERFAEVMAHRKLFPQHADEVLLRLGVRPARWARAARAWGDALAAATAAEEPALLLRFARAFGATSRKLREFPPRLEDLGDPIDPNVHDAEERAPAVEKPSFMLDEKPRETAPPPPEPHGSSSVWMQYAKNAPPPPPAPAPLPSPPASDLASTRPAFRPARKLPTMPFQMPPESPSAQNAPRTAEQDDPQKQGKR